MFAGNVDQLTIVFDIEVLVIADIGVEIGLAGIDNDFVLHAGLRELMQRVVNGGERDADARFGRFVMQ